MSYGDSNLESSFENHQNETGKILLTYLHSLPCTPTLRPAFVLLSVLTFRRGGVSQVHYKRTEGSL